MYSIKGRPWQHHEHDASAGRRHGQDEGSGRRPDGPGREEYGKDGGHDLFHDAGGKKESGSSESFQKAQDCKRSRGRHQRSQPDGQAIRRDEEDDEDGGKKRQKRKVPPAVLKLVYRAGARYIDNEKILWR